MNVLEKLGCFFVAVSFVALFVFLVVKFLIWFALLAIGILLLIGYQWFAGVTEESDFRTDLRARGKVGIFVYSESPNWKEYVESELLPRVSEKLIPLNWSKRSSWKHLEMLPLEVRIFQKWSERGKFGPMAIIFPTKGKRQMIYFRKGFIDSKHGKPFRLQSLQNELFSKVDAESL